MIHFSKKNSKEKLVEELLLKNYDHYYRLAYSYVHNEADAGDIVQNGAVKVIMNSEKLKKEEYAATWIYRIMLNEIFRFYKGNITESIEQIKTEIWKEDTYKDFDLEEALEQLSKEDKAVIELRYFEEMKLEEIAEILEENVSTIKSRLYRGIKKLREKLEDIDLEGYSAYPKVVSFGKEHAE